MMQRTVLACLLALALVACATPPTPFAAAGPQGIGYSELRIEQNRYRVTWRGTDHPGAPGEDLALLRAADLALANGYDWFRVVSRNDTAAQSRGPTLSLGTGGADYGRHSAVGLGIGTSFNLGGPPLRAVTLEVLMEKGTPPHEAGAYDAHDAAKTIRGRI
jgi:hypothetical protein